MNRRIFVFRTLFSAALGIAVRPALSASTRNGNQEQKNDLAPLPRVSDPGEMRGEMLYRKLGNTGETVSAIGLGGSHIGKPAVTEAEATRLIHQRCFGKRRTRSAQLVCNYLGNNSRSFRDGLGNW
jgi:hypothetical protein